MVKEFYKECYKLEIYHSIYNMIEYEKIYNEIKKKYKIYTIEGFSEGESIGLIRDSNGNILFCFQYYHLGINPKLLVILDTGLFFLGVSLKVLIIDIKEKKIIRVISENNDNVFFEFIEIEDKIIAIFELEAYAMNLKGEIIWHIIFSDIAIDYKIMDNILYVKTYDNLKVCYSIKNGKMVDK